MNDEIEILDKPDERSVEIIKSDNRIFKDLTIVVGVIYLILSLFLFYSVYTVVSWKIELVSVMGYEVSDINWFKVIGQTSPGLIYASFFFVGAIGLFRRSGWGWAVSLTISIIALIFPLITLISDLIYSGRVPNTPFWMILLLTAVFGLIVLYLSLKPTRKLFMPSRKSYIFVFASVFALILHQLWVPLIR